MVRLGNEELLANPDRYFDGGNIALVVNQSSFTPSMESLVEACIKLSQSKVSAVFGPEHGAFGAMQDMESVPDEKLSDEIPLYSLYGADESTLSPSPKVMENIDTLVIDLQDVGSRYYTFIWTMLYCMEACEKFGVDMVVCDRPNPLGGLVMEGPAQKPGYHSFVGRISMPVRHAMTVGEIALMLKSEIVPGCKLKIAPMHGWRRGMWFDDTGLPWIPPSPNMPSLTTAITYPGGCLVEGTSLSEGRGTTTPFEQIGAPGIDGDKLALIMNRKKLAGCVFRPVVFVPKFQKHCEKSCSGVYVHVVDRDAFMAFDTYALIIREIAVNFPESFAWRADAYEFVKEIPAIDLLTGSNEFRHVVDKGENIDQIFHDAVDDVGLFAEKRKEYLLYD